MKKKVLAFLAVTSAIIVSSIFLFPAYLFAPSLPIYFYNPDNGHYYELVENELTWQDANNAAQGMWYKGHQGHLVTITSQSEQSFIEKKFLNDRDLWIGAYQLWNPGDDPDDGWHWVTGEKWIYENWNDDEPNDWQTTGFIEDGEEDNGEIYPTGVWNDIPADETQWFIVEFDLHLIVEPVWIRDREMMCNQVWINEDGDFQLSFIYPYADNNWVKIYDMADNLVYEVDMPYDNPNIIVDLPDGMYKVKTFHDQVAPIQEFVIGKP